jgi:hypothetical protein
VKSNFNFAIWGKDNYLYRQGTLLAFSASVQILCHINITDGAQSEGVIAHLQSGDNIQAGKHMDRLSE